MGPALTPPAAMAERRGADPGVGTRVRMKATGRTGAIKDVYERGGRTLYDVEFDRSAEETSGLAVRDFAIVGVSADAFDVLP
jgi:hypothetical protein